MNSCELTDQTVSGLDIDFKFELIPDCPAATNAGYTDIERAQANVWYGPVMDALNIYCVAWSGSVFNPFHKSSIFTCRNRFTGELKYAINCDDLSLDTDPARQKVLCRTRPYIFEDTVYLTNFSYGTLGPVLFALNKFDGSLKWAAAYYPPSNLPSSYITTQADYSLYANNNKRLSDMNVSAANFYVGGVKKRYVFVGSSSFQNTINFGFNGTGYPAYTDQGFLFCIEDKGNSSALVWKAPTCAPPLVLGDTIYTPDTAPPGTYEPMKDPFSPGSYTTQLESLTSVTNNFVTPFFDPNPPAPGQPNTCYTYMLVTFGKFTVINITQPIWGSLPIDGSYIYQDSDSTTPYTLAQLYVLWANEQATMAPTDSKTHIIWAFLTQNGINTAVSQLTNTNIVYFKQMIPGTTLTEDYDVQSLNYWGNSVWGQEATIDVDNNLVYWASGQSHEAPLSDFLYYGDPTRNIVALKKPVLDAMDQYREGLLPIDQLNKIKATYMNKVKELSLKVDDRSPRSVVSYNDSIFANYVLPYELGDGTEVPGGTFAFAVRTINFDNYTFLATDSSSIYPGYQVVDGDVSSGIEIICRNYNKYLATATKAGFASVLNVTKLNRSVKFDHYNFDKTGIVFERMIYSGPFGALGGSNYQNSSHAGLLLNSQANTSWSLPTASTSSKGNLEAIITEQGDYVPINNAMLNAIDIVSGNTIWEYNFGYRAFPQVECVNGLVFSSIGDGNVQINDAHTGFLLWKFHGAVNGMNGGIAAPAVICDQVVWANNYAIQPFTGSSGKYGISFKVNKKILINKNTDIFRCLTNNKYTSYDINPKLQLQNPFIPPVINVLITQTWEIINCCIYVHAVHTPLLRDLNAVPTKITAKVDKVVNNNKKIIFACCYKTDVPIRYLSINMINLKTYELVYEEFENNDYINKVAWLNCDSQLIA
jgi:hypothetical protein